MNSRIQALERRIDGIKRELVRLGDLRFGSLSQQYNVCGGPGCRCKASPPVKHGPYYQLSYTRKGKSSTRFVRPMSLGTVRRQIRNYAKLRELVDQWGDLATELSNLKIDQRQKAALRRGS